MCCFLLSVGLGRFCWPLVQMRAPPLDPPNAATLPPLFVSNQIKSRLSPAQPAGSAQRVPCYCDNRLTGAVHSSTARISDPQQQQQKKRGRKKQGANATRAVGSTNERRTGPVSQKEAVIIGLGVTITV